ncbi:RHS repeat-associated core domain-containing protein [Fontivita pretiosa]|uniref:RHS repeat-associated core domain-containing protein n=1 Tax=Fontivita pretiosa TaxID=2989684 RepID=UPI003D16292D
MTRTNSCTSFDSDGKVTSSSGDYASVSSVARDSDGRLVVAEWTEVPSTGDDFSLVRYNAGGLDLEERLYAQQDANFNVTSVTDTSGAVQERYLYDPYGVASYFNASWGSISTSSGVNWVYLHQGGRYDAISGLYHFRNRDYSPTLGRWMQQDGNREVPHSDGTNLYQFVTSNPASLLDPIGLESLTTKLNKAFFGLRLVGGLVSLTIANRTIYNYEYYDEEKEMWGQLNGNMLDFYSKYLRDVKLTAEWQVINVSANAPQVAPSAGGPFWTVTGRAFTWGYWLGSSSTVNANGFLRARCDPKNPNAIQIKSIMVLYDWIDDVDAKSLSEMWSDPQQGWGNWFFEGLWNWVGDGLLDTDYHVTVSTWDIRDGPITIVRTPPTTRPLGGRP